MIRYIKEFQAKDCTLIHLVKIEESKDKVTIYSKKDKPSTLSISTYNQRNTVIDIKHKNTNKIIFNQCLKNLFKQ